MPDPKVNIIVGAATAAAQRSLGVLSTAFGNMIARWQDYALMAGRAITRQIGSSIEFADQINKLAQKTGIAHRELSALVYVADLADVGIGEFELSLRQLNQWLERTGQGSRSTMDVLLETADQFSQMTDGPAKTALAMERFGRAGTQMIPLLNQGSQAIREMVDEAERFGLVIDQDAAEAAEKFNDNLKRLGYAGKGLSLQVAEALLPRLNDVTEELLDLAANSHRVEIATKAIAAAFDYVVDKGETWSQIISGLSSMMRGEGYDRGYYQQLQGVFEAKQRAAEQSERAASVGAQSGKVADAKATLSLELESLKVLGERKPAGKELLDILYEQLELATRIASNAKATALLEVNGTEASIDAQREYLKTMQEVFQIGDRVAAQQAEVGRGSFTTQMGAQWSGMITRLGTDAEIAASGITRAFEGAWQSVSTGLVNIIDQTGTWTDLLRSVRRVILQEVMNAIVQMFMRWIAMETLKAMVSIGLAKKETLAKKGPALLESIKSYGIAALVGGAAFLAITAAMGGFRKGGYTGNGSDDEVAGVVHAGEYVIPAPQVRDIGIPTLEAMRLGRGGFSPRNYPTAAGGASGGSAGSASRVNVVLVDSRRAAERWMEENGEARIIDVLNRS